MAKHQMPEPIPTPCPECHHQRFLAEGVNSVRLIEKGAAIPGITGGFSEMWALVCPNCGYTALYAKDPGKIQKH